MGRLQARVLLGLLLSLGLIGASAFLLDWFQIKMSVPSMGDLAPTLAMQDASIDLRAIHSCSAPGVCASVSLSQIKGAYPTLASGAFWISILLLVLVAVQSAQRLTGNTPAPRFTKTGYFAAMGVFILGGLAGYLFSPQTEHGIDVSVVVTRTWAPFLLLIGCLTSAYTLYKAQFGSSLDDDAPYVPIKVAKVSTKPAAPAPAPAGDDDDEVDTPPIVDAPKRDQRPKQILTPGGTQPPAKTTDDIPLPPPRASSVRLPSSIPLEDPIGDFELGAPGGVAVIEDSKSKYQSPEVVFDPNTPSIPLAPEDAVATARTKSATIPPIARPKAPSMPPIMERPTVPTIPPPVQAAAESGLSMRTQRPSSSPPLTEGGVVVRMRPPSQPPVVAEATPRKGTPGQGVVIRAKPPTAPPLLEGPRRGTPSAGVPMISRSKTPGSLPVVTVPPEPEVVVPAGLAGKLRYATLTATLSHVGIEARREDGFARTVMWPDVVGIVARRLPAEEPFEGATFVDVVSTAGATLRILPWTRLAGDRIDGEGIERARAFVQLAAARCPSAKLDAATRTFLGSHGQAAQLPDEPTLVAHDRRLS